MGEHRQLNDLLAGFLDMDPAERAAFLSSPDLDADLKNEIESLVNLEKQAGNFMSLSAAGIFAETIGETADRDRVGERLGPFEVQREIGRGGMGSVYLAERFDKKFDQKVAIKILKRDLDTAELRTSFEHELKIQSKLVHPNIASIIDAGTTEDGLPFIAMEYVEGRSIDRYCEEKELVQLEILKLFNKVCDAVGYAHRNLVVHRDIKPANIVVTDSGVPKLLDFGVSELVTPDGDPDLGRAAFGLTPDYSSPEQSAGGSTGISSDIYSLGAVLHKLLTGRPPSEGNIVSAADSKAANSPDHPEHTGLPDELDAIVRKAIATNPEDRYETADRFSADIWKFIDGYPVDARPSTRSYRLKKLIERRRIVAAAGLIVLVAMVGGTAAALWQARSANTQAAIAKSEKDKSEKISKFMFRVLAYGNPRWYSVGAEAKGNARVIDVMLELGSKIDTEFAADPDVAAELHHRFADVMLSSGQDIKLGLFHAQRALELRTSVYGEHHEMVAKDMYYIYNAQGVDPERRATYLYDAIEMMRSTNPKNLNLPYMIEDFTSRILLPKYKTIQPQYASVLTQRTGREPLEVVEEMTIEAENLFLSHFDESYPSIKLNRCRLAYVQLLRGKLEESRSNERVCRDAIETGIIRSSAVLSEIEALRKSVSQE